jgi:hypothetical protein
MAERHFADHSHEGDRSASRQDMLAPDPDTGALVGLVGWHSAPDHESAGIGPGLE